ncbi:hypothetical protein QR685DRAFT_234855 [Neurospora intermedia]|uniref:Secreted protein n=1 Tax=Neurospora intermedia TaxID=5142 RepID=A0ABR3DI91_NEUIN
MMETMTVIYVTVAPCSILTQCFQLKQKPNVTHQSNAKSFLSLNRNIGHRRKSFDAPSLQWVYPSPRLRAPVFRYPKTPPSGMYIRWYSE